MNEKHATQSQEHLEESLRNLKRKVQLKDLFIVIVPLLVAGLTVFFSTRSNRETLNHSRQIEGAKIIINLMEDIMKGGENAQLAKIAFENVPLTESQRDQLSSFLEQKIGGSDSPQLADSTPQHAEFKFMLDDLFNDTYDIRKTAYVDTRNYLQTHPDTVLVGLMFNKVRDNPFNVKGRSNVLSILSSSDPALINSSRSRLQDELKWIENLEGKSPSYAVGPQTKKWMSSLNHQLRISSLE